MSVMPIITLTTDFGTADHYVAAMKGAIWSIAPDAKITDVTHDIPRQGIARAAFVLRQVWSTFPPGTIHVVVVDPGVGSDRAILLGKFDDRFLIAPDNGLVSWVHRDFAAQSLHLVENSQYFLPGESNTFHGRDILAPVAGHLASGVSLDKFGPRIEKSHQRKPHLLELPYRAKRVGDVLRGTVIHKDRFGNLVTNIHEDQLPARGDAPGLEVLVNGKYACLLKKTYSDVADGGTVAMIGSAGFVEVSVRNASAAERFVPLADLVITIRPCNDEPGQH